MQKIKAPAWIEVDTGAVVHNLNNIKNYVKDTKILAVVKADAYGLGMEETGRILMDAGADMLGVTSLQEALGLRQAGIKTSILIFSPLLSEELTAAVEENFTLTISSQDDLQEVVSAAGKYNKTIKIHLKIETGMGRIGFLFQELKNIISIIKNEKLIICEGVYTHFSKAYDFNNTKEQFSKFEAALKFLKEQGISFDLAHCCNSTAAIMYPEMHLDMVRLGTILYGQHPLALNKSIELKDPFQVKAKIIAVSTLSKGYKIGYGGDYKLRRDSKIAVIPIGYADGYSMSPMIKAKSFVDLIKIFVKETLAYMGKGPQAPKVGIEDKMVPIVGRIGMQLSMIDVTDVSDIKKGQEITVSMRRVSSSYKLPRVYIKEGQVYNIRYAGNMNELQVT
jgi:alanine racemase